MVHPNTFRPVPPRHVPEQQGCTLYHSVDLADGTSVTGPWDMRGQFGQYVGDVDLAGKTVPDVGTASGFLAFSAEQTGAQVTAMECRQVSEYDQLHFAGLPFHENRPLHDAAMDDWLDTLKAGFWYAWHRNRSKVEVVYAPIAALPYWHRRFDVVIAGALLEHLADPVSAIWSMSMVARETVVIAFTPVIPDEGTFMQTANTWDNPQNNFTWWTLSAGLYRRIFANIGFATEFRPATARAGDVTHTRSTVVARRIAPLPT